MEWYTRASALGFISVFANSACGADAKDPRHVVVLYHVCSASSECEDAAADTPDQIRRPDATFPDVTIVVPPGCGEETVPGWQDYPPCSHGVCMPTEEFPPALHNYLPVDSCDTDQRCAPEYIAKTGGDFELERCKSIGDAEGRCVPERSPVVGNYLPHIPQDNCSREGDVCMPCFHPTTSEDLGICSSEISCSDPGATVEPTPLPECCGGVGFCTPTNALGSSTTEMKPRDCQYAGTVCAPREKLDGLGGEDKPELRYCETGKGEDGRCLNEDCFLKELGAFQRGALNQDGCRSGELCVPCETGISDSTGVCD
ncbi:MAG: hypothetical protein HRU17_04385 [Polyangiaceae bacterium]|nr:hypothetical protein [Polyangiaceae bacterium]